MEIGRDVVVSADLYLNERETPPWEEAFGMAQPYGKCKLNLHAYNPSVGFDFVLFVAFYLKCKNVERSFGPLKEHSAITLQVKMQNLLQLFKKYR